MPLAPECSPEKSNFTKFNSSKMYADSGVKDKYSRILLQTIAKELKNVDILTPQVLEEQFSLIKKDGKF